MLNNYYKVKIPVVSKGYFDFKEKGKISYKYSGIVYILIEKETNCISYTTLLLNDEEIIGANNYRNGYQSNDYLGSKKIIKKYRLDVFDKNDIDGYKGISCKNKGKSKFVGNIDDLNNRILENKLTAKDVDAFITGSNSSGGLKKPSADPIDAYYENDDLFSKVFKGNVIEGKKKWKIFSLLSNLTCVQRNSVFPDKVTRDYLNKVEKKDVSYLFELEWKVVPWSLKGEEDLYVDFKRAFASQNKNKFIDKEKDTELLCLSEQNWREADHIQYIMKIIDNGDRKFVTKQLRGNWRRVIDESISNNKFKSDFVNDYSIYDRAHILENRDAIKYILSEEISKYEKEEFLKELFDEDNFILLDKNTHKAWDEDKIFIDEKGYIKNISLDNSEFKRMFSDSNNNIFNVYPNVLDGRRSLLLNKRNKRRGL